MSPTTAPKPEPIWITKKIMSFKVRRLKSIFRVSDRVLYPSVALSLIFIYWNKKFWGALPEKILWSGLKNNQNA